VVKAAENGNGLDGGTSAELLGRRRNRYSLTKPMMRPCPIEIVSGIDPQHIRKVASPEDDDVIQTLAPYAPKKAFAPSVHERRLDCRSHDFLSGTLRAKESQPVSAGETALL